MNDHIDNRSLSLCSDRLELIAFTPETAPLVVGDRVALSQFVNAAVPDDWPPEHIDAQSIGYMVDRMTAVGQKGWWLWLVIAKSANDTETANKQRMLVGTAGYKGPADETGSVEVGYSVVPSQQRRGYATEAVSRLIERAWEFPEVKQILGETLPHLTPSIRVMEKLGFNFIGTGSEEGVIRYVLMRGVTDSEISSSPT